MASITANKPLKESSFSSDASGVGGRNTPSSLPTNCSSVDEIGCELIETPMGAQFADRQIFLDKTGTIVEAIPMVVDFRRLFDRTSTEVLTGVPNRELLHAVVALYDLSLSEMTPDVLYATVCEKWARTLLLVRDFEDVKAELERKPRKKSVDVLKSVSERDEQFRDEDLSDVTDSPAADDDEKDTYVEEETKPSVFTGVFSDDESEEDEDDEDDDDDPDYSEGINAFIRSVRNRKRALKNASVITEYIGIEKRLVAACTFDKTYCKSERVVHLTLIAVRKKYRNYGIGRYLLSQVKDPTISGLYGAVVVHADNSAVEFFERYGFLDDVVLNSKWSDLAEQFTNCTMMSYLPPFTGAGILGDTSSEIDLAAMELEIKKWRQKSLDAYAAEVTVATRLRNEIIHLKALTTSQKELIEKLAAENEILSREKYDTQKEYLRYRYMANKYGAEKAESEIKNASSLVDKADESWVTCQLCDDEKQRRDSGRWVGKYGVEDLSSDDESEIKYLGNADKSKDVDKEKDGVADKGLTKVKKDAKDARRDSAELNIIDRTRYMVYTKENQEPYDHMKDAQDFYRVTEEFKSSMQNDPLVKGYYEVKLVVKATVTSHVKERYATRCSQLHDMNKLRLYYCGSLDDQARLSVINKQGFSEKDFASGEYGRGLYFSVYPSRAAHYSALNKLLIAEVAVGKTLHVDKKDHTRASAPPGYDSVMTPGRLSHSSIFTSKDAAVQAMNEEYMIFDVKQVLPLHIVEYAMTRPV